jgi:hypothetical protein
MAISKQKPASEAKPADKQIHVKQSDFPQTTLQDAQRIAATLMDNFAGKEASPPDVALALGVSPSSSGWRVLAGSSIAYGLTDGGHNAAVIKLLPLGRRLVAPEEEGDDIAARREAILKPRIQREFFERYRRAKFPVDAIATNVLRAAGIPNDRLAGSAEVLKENGRYAGVIRDTPTGPFINLDSPGIPAPVTTPITEGDEPLGNDAPLQVPALTGAPVTSPLPAPLSGSVPDLKTTRVFISHGRQRAVVIQIKELLAFGNFEPVVSVERESTAIPVPEKVFEDMRSCGAGVIHVGSEGNYLDRDGNEHVKINDNVLIEIGAAIALFGKRIILLVEKDVPLPSNLQGLYRCEFEGDKLDYDATMKLLKTFSQFR